MIIDGIGRVSDVRNVMDGSAGGEICGNAPRLREKWRIGPLTNSARSGVVMIVWAVETLRQCLKVSSDLSVNLNNYAEGLKRYLEGWCLLTLKQHPVLTTPR